MSRLISPQEIFQLHEKIRWTAFSTQDGRVAFSEMRPGVRSYTSESDDRAFMELGPHLMSGVAEKLSSTGAGKVQSLIVNLEKDSVFLTQLDDGYLAISADRADAPNVFKEIEPKIRRL